LIGIGKDKRTGLAPAEVANSNPPLTSVK